MDQTRLVELRSEVVRVTAAATVMLLVVSSVSQLQSNAAFKLSLKDHVLLLLQDTHTIKYVYTAPRVYLYLLLLDSHLGWVNTQREGKYQLAIYPGIYLVVI